MLIFFFFCVVTHGNTLKRRFLRFAMCNTFFFTIRQPLVFSTRKVNCEILTIQFSFNNSRLVAVARVENRASWDDIRGLKSTDCEFAGGKVE